MKRLGVIAGIFATALVLGAITATSASANLPLTCYEVSEFKAKVHAGNFIKRPCNAANEGRRLEEPFVLAEPVKKITGDLWCAKITQTPIKQSETGNFSDAACTKPHENGEYIEVEVTLPDISLALEAEKYPAVAAGELKSADTLETIIGEKIEGTLVKLTLELKELSALGAYTAIFTGVKQKTLPCKTTGASKEEVVNPGEFHLVLSASGTLQLLFLPTGFTFECGEPAKVKVKVKGKAVASVKAALEEEITTLGGILEGTKGKQNLTSYLGGNDELVEKAFLESNFGLGYEQSMESVTGELTLKLEGGKMIEIDG